MLAFGRGTGKVLLMETHTNTEIVHLNGTDIYFDLSDTTRVTHQMFVIGNSYYAHITKEVAQATINTGIVGDNISAITLCNKTYTNGDAWEFTENTNDAIKVCKACAKKAGK